MSDLARHFDAEAAQYPTHIGSGHTQNRKWELIDLHAPTDGRAADIGAASGRHAVKLAARATHVVAVDPSEKMLGKLVGHARKNELAGIVQPCAAALPDLPFSNDSFDLVYCFSTLLLLSPPAQIEALKNMSRMLRPGGILIVDIAGAQSLAICYWRRHYRRQGLSGVFGQKRTHIIRLLQEMGLEMISCEPHGVLSQLLLVPGLQKFRGLDRRVRGSESASGWDAMVSKRLPQFAERWYVVACKPIGAD